MSLRALSEAIQKLAFWIASRFNAHFYYMAHARNDGNVMFTVYGLP
jgi:hypothetical protein